MQKYVKLTESGGIDFAPQNFKNTCNYNAPSNKDQLMNDGWKILMQSSEMPKYNPDTQALRELFRETEKTIRQEFEVVDLTKDQIAEKRKKAYEMLADPITIQIQRLRDDDPPDEAKISDLIVQRTAFVNEIQTRFPYPKSE